MMLNYCGIAFVETASGLWVPDPQQPCPGGLYACFQQRVNRRATVSQTAEAYCAYVDSLKRFSYVGGQWADGRRPADADNHYLSDFITDGPLSDSTVEDVLGESP